MFNSGRFRLCARPTRWFRAAAVSLLGSIVAGCAAPPVGPELLTIEADSYDDAFAAVLAAAREEGFVLTLRDRRSGVIQTEPRPAASLLEPWRSDNTSFGDTVDNTIAYRRRSARFEFAPSGFRPTPVLEDLEHQPDLFLQRAMLDLTEHDGPLELRVWVYVEQAYSPGVRRSTWTRDHTTRTIAVPSDPTVEPDPPTYWTPTRRDRVYEGRLLEAVRRLLEADSTSRQT